MFDKALAFRRANTHETKTYDEFKKAVETGFAFAHWCDSGECEEKIKEETRATMRCIPLDQADVLGHGACILKVDLLWSDLHIEQCGLDIGMTHQLHECGQADASSHHVRGKRVPKPMRVGQRDAGGLAMVAEQGP